MKRILICGLLFILLIIAEPVLAGTGTGTIDINVDQANGGTDYFTVYCNVEGAQVYFTDYNLFKLVFL